MNHLATTLEAGLEVRYLSPEFQIEARSTVGQLDFRGYASVYDEWYDVAGGPEQGGWRERILPGAAKRTLRAKPDVRLLLDHSGMPIARTKSGTLLLEEDARGLLALAPTLDTRDPDVQRVGVKMERHDVDSMSFAFRVTRQDWNPEYTERTIREFALDIEGSDVSIVTFPANKAAIASIRSAARIDELRASITSSVNVGVSLDVARAIRAQIRRI
jgi:HK97 family phage prohead protease